MKNQDVVEFHPNLTLVEAACIADAHGGTLVWLNGKIRFSEAIQHVDQAMAAVDKNDYDVALKHICKGAEVLEGGEPCLS